MYFAVFSIPGLLFILRWLHLFFGILWVGHLYYFNFTQSPVLAEADAPTQSVVTRKLLPKAWGWFRWSAMITFLLGWIYLGIRGHSGGASHQIFATPWGVIILTGAVLASLMWFNVWFVLWPMQRKLIESTEQVSAGGKPLPDAGPLASRTAIVSRTNVLLSIPMLFMMGAASHLPIEIRDSSRLLPYAITVAVLLALIELNALKGRMGPMKSIAGVVHIGFVLAIVMYVIQVVVL